MNKILTIVVPTFNAERYLRDNLNSFCIKEIIEDIEVLIINDGSTDNSAEIAAEYVKNFPKTYRIVTKENGGHGSGINCGISLATGTYLKVVDADDWVDKTAFLKFVKFLKTQCSDLVYTGFLWVFDRGEANKELFRKKTELPIPFHGVAFEKEYMFDDIASNLYIKMHNLTIKTELLRKYKISIDENCYYVDTEFITYPIPFIKTICFFDAFVYMYRIHGNGQSIDIHKMQANKENYDRVLSSLLNFYQALGHTVPCTAVKRSYIAKIIARVVAGNVKVILSFPANREHKRDLVMADKQLQVSFPQIYRANVNWGIKILRWTDYRTYYLASWLVQKKYRF